MKRESKLSIGEPRLLLYSFVLHLEQILASTGNSVSKKTSVREINFYL